MALPIILFCMAACQQDIADTPDALSPAIMIDGIIYYSLGKEWETDPAESSYSGRVTSVVNVHELPTKNEEANILCLDTPYVILDDGVAVLFNEKMDAICDSRRFDAPIDPFVVRLKGKHFAPPFFGVAKLVVDRFCFLIIRKHNRPGGLCGGNDDKQVS